MNKLMIGAAMGFMAGAGLMMTATGRAIRKYQEYKNDFSHCPRTHYANAEPHHK